MRARPILAAFSHTQVSHDELRAFVEERERADERDGEDADLRVHRERREDEEAFDKHRHQVDIRHRAPLGERVG